MCQNRHCRRSPVYARTCARQAATALAPSWSVSTAARVSSHKASAGPSSVTSIAVERYSLSAVFGGVYMLGEEVVAIERADDGRHRITLGKTEPQTVTADTVVLAPEYRSLASPAPAPAKSEVEAIARGVWIVASLPPALQAAAAAPRFDDAETGPSSPKPLDAALFVLPPGDGRASSAFALAVGEAAFACPADQCACVAASLR